MNLEPLRLTPLERHIDDLLRFENRERYVQQSAMGVLPARGHNYDAGSPQPVVSFELRRGE